MRAVSSVASKISRLVKSNRQELPDLTADNVNSEDLSVAPVGLLGT
jgi:hypothetical protein